MSDILASVVFEHKSGLIEDRVVNDWVFKTDTTPYTSGELDDIQSAIADFYNVTQSSGSKVCNLLGTQLDRASNKVATKMYNLAGHLDGSPHGSPVATYLWTLGAAQGGETNLPSEVAIVLSSHADLFNVPVESGGERPAARHKGRIYLGPLLTLARSVDGTTNRVGVSSTARTTITQAAAAIPTNTGADWAVWSRRDAVTRLVVGGFVDDAFDTQRRRGETATARTTFTR